MHITKIFWLLMISRFANIVKADIVQSQQGIHRHQTPPQYRIAIRPIMAKRDVIHKTRNTQHIATLSERRTKPWPQEICIKNFVQIGPVVLETYLQTDRHTDKHTDRQTDCNTLAPWSKKANSR